jgi:hypothetical protein
MNNKTEMKYIRKNSYYRSHSLTLSKTFYKLLYKFLYFVATNINTLFD